MTCSNSYDNHQHKIKKQDERGLLQSEYPEMYLWMEMTELIDKNNPFCKYQAVRLSHIEGRDTQTRGCW